MKHIAESTVRRLSLYLRFLEEYKQRGLDTISSGDLASLGGTTSAQVRKDLSFFGSFGTRGLGYSVGALAHRIREILGLEREWRVIIIGAGKIGAALAQYRGFRDRGFRVVGIYDVDPTRIGMALEANTVKDQRELDGDIAKLKPDIALIAVPSDAAQALVDRVTKVGVRGVLNFAPSPLHAASGVALRNVDMALELEILTYALASSKG